MYMNKFITGAVIGGAIGVIGTTYALATNSQKRSMVKQSKRFIDMANNRVRDYM